MIQISQLDKILLDTSGLYKKNILILPNDVNGVAQ